MCVAVGAAGQAPEKRVGVVARVLTQPPMSPEAVASAEAAVAANPGDSSTRLRLLTHYRESFPIPPNDDPVKRAARLRHIAYMVEHQPAAIDAASPLFYVFRSGGLYADPSDHELVRGLWVRQAGTNPGDARMVVNAARFLFVENKQEAEDLLRRAVESEPAERRLAANLGFLYAMQILGLDNFGGDLTSAAPAAEREEARTRAVSALENGSNALVLAGAATAIPNLAMRASRGRPVDPELFQFASRLMTKARSMAPSEEALRGPMPLIEYFQEAQGAPGAAAPASGGPPARIRIGSAVQMAKLIEAPQPKYPEEAKRLGMEGDVRFDAVIGHDGGIAGLTLRSGHPLLVPAATEAVRRWRFQPTLLNGNPVEVATEIGVSFPGK